MTDRLSWERDGRDWPNRQASRFVKAAGFTWHVQLMGQGPAIMLVHGTGASTHSWRHLMPRIAKFFTVVAADLPGHGFTEMPADGRLSLPAMADGLGELLRALEIRPALAVGHSAGAAILIRTCLDGKMAPKGVISINGALLPFGGWASETLAPLARLLAASSLTARVMSWRAARRSNVEELIRGTGSRLEPEDIDLYARLFQSAGHVRGALGMMASWDLAALARDLPRLKIPLVLVAGDGDRAIPPSDALRVRDLVPGATVVRLCGLGHLAHEEQPENVAEFIIDTARGLSASAAA